MSRVYYITLDIMIKNKCKLMFFVYILGQGGAERVITNVINNIDLNKYDVYLTMGQKEGNSYLDFLVNKDKITINYLDVPLGDNLEAEKKLAELIDQLEIDVLFTEAFYTNNLAFHAKRMSKRNVKLIFREANTRSVYEEKTIKNFLKTFIMYNFYAKKIVAVGEGVKDDLIKKYKVKKSKIITIKNPLDLNMITTMSNKKIKDSEFEKITTKKIISIGRLTEGKDQKTLLKAFKIISENRNDVSLILIGKGHLENELKQYVRKNKIKNVIFLGFKDNPYQYLRNSDLFILSSKVEGFVNVVLESMAVGTAVISTDCKSSPREILGNDEYGLIVPVADSHALANAITKMLDNDEMRANYVKKAKKEVEKYDIKKIVKKYEKVIDSVYTY